MSKVDELRKKYPFISSPVFNKFVDEDKTSTKKYLPFMLKTWVNKKGHINTSADLVNLVHMFDDLLPYIENKDIYSKEYESVERFVEVINEAIDIKDEKTFVREEHVNVLFEDDELILLNPKTHRGSCKYGANTKWCTASKNKDDLFKSYSKRGFLAYLISKKELFGNTNKVAFFCEDDPFRGGYSVYDVKDSSIDDARLLDSGWKPEDILKISFIIRSNYLNWKVTKHAKDRLTDIINKISKVDFTGFEKSVEVLEKSKNFDYISEVKGQINKFIETLTQKL